MLSLYLTGKFRLLHNGKSLTDFRSDKVRALLAYLVLAQGRPFTRVQLSDLLWSESLPRSARTSLRSALSNLRRVLVPMNDLLELDGQLVWFNHHPPQFWCDVSEDETLMASPLFLLNLQHIPARNFQSWLIQQKSGLTI